MVFAVSLKYLPQSVVVGMGTAIVLVLMTDIQGLQRRSAAAGAGLVVEEAAGIVSFASYAVDKAVVVVAAVVEFETIELHRFCPQDDLMEIPPRVLLSLGQCLCYLEMKRELQDRIEKEERLV